MSVEARVRQIVSAHREPPAEATAPLELASLEIVLVAEALEEAFGLKVSARDLTPENFGSVERLVRFVGGHQA